MKRIVKIILAVLASFIVLLALVIFYAVKQSDRKFNRKIEVNAAPVAFVNTPVALAQGKYLFDSRGCGECHGDNGGGKVMIDSPDGFYVRTPNITTAGVTAKYRELDWVLAIRHGVKPGGKPIFVMPSEDYNRLSDSDLAAIVAYARSLPGAPASLAELRLPMPLRALYGLGLVEDAAAKIDHTLPPSRPVEVAVTVAHGEYVAKTCIGCHGPGLSGGKIPGGAPQWPAAANLTAGQGSVMPVYDTPEKFRNMMRTGKRPDGSAVDMSMPFGALKNMSDVDLDATYTYLKTVPAKAAGGR